MSVDQTPQGRETLDLAVCQPLLLLFSTCSDTKALPPESHRFQQGYFGLSVHGEEME